jgi:WD40 repeat protein
VFRWLLICVLLSAGAVALVYLIAPTIAFDNPWSPPDPSPQPTRDVQPPLPVREAPPPRQETRRPSQPALPELVELATQEHASADVLIYGAHLVIFDQQEVPSEKDGKILFIGTEVKPGETVPEELRLPDAEMGFLAVPAERGYEDKKYPPFRLSEDDPTLYRPLGDGEEPEPGKAIAQWRRIHVRKLRIGEKVARGQLLALVNPRMAYDDLAIKVAQLQGADADRLASRKTKEEFRKRYEAMSRQEQIKKGSASQEEIRGTKLQWDKYAHEEKVKEAQVSKSQRELSAALTTLKMHEIRAVISGTIRAISKNSEGEAIKAGEQVLQIQNSDRLRVEGLLEVQEALKLHEGMDAVVEASRPEHPRLVLGGNLGAVNCVAVSKGKQPVVISGGEDGTLRAWDAATGRKLWLMHHLNSPVRAAACTPPAAKRDLVLFGTADGVGRILDLNKRDAGPRELSQHHEGAINACAFSADGEVCATGGDDRAICLWKAETGELLHRLPALHRSYVTSLEFTADNRLVSAGRDGRLLVWDVTPGKPPVRRGPDFEGRGGEVTRLGVSPDGTSVLFDQGKELRLLSLASGKQIRGVLQNPPGAPDFWGMALFAPDGRTVLTNGSAPGRLQLWRTPDAQGRASELRQFIWAPAPATCGAFAPDNSFVVTGTQDHQVLVWAMPSSDEVKKSRLDAKLTLVDRHLDTRSRQVRVWAELVKNRPDWLIPGSTATVVIPPQK